MAVPEEIKALKPTDFGAVEIRCISGHYYVYEISSKWDPKRGKAKKVTGKTIGKITLKDGFIPNSPRSAGPHPHQQIEVKDKELPPAPVHP